MKGRRNRDVVTQATVDGAALQPQRPNVHRKIFVAAEQAAHFSVALKQNLSRVKRPNSFHTSCLQSLRYGGSRSQRQR